MTDALFKPVVDGEVIKLPTPANASPHQWGAHSTGEALWPLNDALVMIRHTERTCALCGLKKLTVHDPNGAFRAWRPKGEGAPFVDVRTPACEVPT